MDLAVFFEQMAAIIGFAIGLFFIFVLAAILLLNRLNMNGWDLPVSYVWFVLSGRINRKTYWLTGVVATILVEIFYELVVNGSIFIASGMFPITETILAITALATAFPFFVFMFWTHIAVSFKRLHDRDYSGWLILLGFIPIIGWLWLLVQLGFLRGTPGDNRFGPEQPDIAGSQSQPGAPVPQFVAAPVPVVDDTPSLNLGELPNRAMITARLGDDFFGPVEPGPEEPCPEEPGPEEPGPVEPGPVEPGSSEPDPDPKDPDKSGT